MWDIGSFVPVAPFPSGEELLTHHQRVLSQVGTHPDMTFDAARTKTPPTNTTACIDCPGEIIVHCATA